MKKFSILSFLIFITSVCACVSVGYLVSSSLVTFGLIGTSVASPEQIVYAISLGKSETSDGLKEEKQNLQTQNGAGFILEFDGNFHCIASVYENKNDAQKVQENLKSTGTESEILTITLSAISVEGNFSTDEKNVLSSCLKANFETYKKLYDVAISLDSGVFDITKAKLECNNIYSAFISTKVNFETLFKGKNMQKTTKNLQNIENALSNLISENYSSANQTFSSLIKETYCKVLFE